MASSNYNISCTFTKIGKKQLHVYIYILKSVYVCIRSHLMTLLSTHRAFYD